MTWKWKKCIWKGADFTSLEIFNHWKKITFSWLYQYFSVSDVVNSCSDEYILIRNIQIYLHFISFSLLFNKMAQVEILTCGRQGPAHLESIPGLLMAWRHKEPWHQQPWYWPSLSSLTSCPVSRVTGQLDWEASKLLYRELLLVFERILLRTHASCHVQFLLFYICSFKEVSMGHVPGQYLYENSKADIYMHCWENNHVPSLKNHLPSQAMQPNKLQVYVCAQEWYLLVLGVP